MATWKLRHAAWHISGLKLEGHETREEFLEAVQLLERLERDGHVSEASYKRMSRTQFESILVEIGRKAQLKLGIRGGT